MKIEQNLNNYYAPKYNDIKSGAISYTGTAGSLKRTLQSRVINNSGDYSQFIDDVLHSPYRKEFEKHLNKYLSYFRLNFQDSGAVSKLEKLIESGQYNAREFDAKYYVEDLLKIGVIRENKFINPTELEKNYSKEGVNFLDEFFTEYYTHRGVQFLSESDSANLMEIYKTSNKDNAYLRTRLMYNHRYAQDKNQSAQDFASSEISNMRKLFDRIDNDKHSKSFIQKAIDEKINFESFAEINKLFDKFGSKKLDIFFDNVKRIFFKARLKERFSALEKGIMDPFYETEDMRINRRINEEYAYSPVETRSQKLLKKIKNAYHKFIYKHTAESDYVPAQTVKNSKQPAKIDLTPVCSQPDFEPALNLVSMVKQSPESRKFKVISDVNDVISKTLKKSVLEKQKDEYSKNATKMRLKLLPDMFESVKLTRKADRAAGKKRPRSSNSDALTLYKLINGKNRKLIRYMLNKNNADGTRMFEVKDIIATIRNAETDIGKIKASDKTFKAADVKAYYNLMHEDMVAKYGKLPPKRKKKSL